MKIDIAGLRNLVANVNSAAEMERYLDVGEMTLALCDRLERYEKALRPLARAGEIALETRIPRHCSLWVATDTRKPDGVLAQITVEDALEAYKAMKESDE